MSLELVIVTPVLILVIMLIVHLALAMHAQHVAQAAASRALAAARADGGTASTGQQRADATLNAIGHDILRDRRITVIRDLDQVRVVIEGKSPAVVPGLHLTVKAVAAGPTDRFRPDTQSVPGRR